MYYRNKNNYLINWNWNYLLHEAKNNDTKINLTKDKLISQNKKLKKNIEELFRLENTIEGIPIKTVLDEWLEKSVEVQNIKAKFKTVGDRNNNYDQNLKDMHQQEQT